MKQTRPLPSIEEILRKDREFKDQLERAMEADAKARWAKVMRSQFPAGERVSRSAWMSGPSRDELHVWLHVTDDGEPFFVGRGRGATAWERNGGLAWEWFVREELGGSYHVVIPASDLNERGSQILVDAVMCSHWDKLLNQSNIHRPAGGPDSDRRWEALGNLKPCYEAVKQAGNDELRARLALEAQELQYLAANFRMEQGRFGEVLHKMKADRATNMFFIKPLIESLMRLGRVEDARHQMARFKELAPVEYRSPTAAKLQVIVDRGTYRKRSKKL
ncbi:hypothetical protein IB223_14675 [Pseudoxanthomonas sp. PXM03]|uniref:hypothetical protein n=1 Tax=Pseudoxanthomonas sp. PXM03 TaxID=2769284 RepID=UPI00177BA403|nr:hypothetical protein [Pseudoxanthomonas sp. PXM03]MBD9437345.1 hypothetical protein [Pseudoxanthomonas sp. PXM03]